MRPKNGNKEPLPAIQTTIESPHYSHPFSKIPFAKTSSPTLIVFDVFIWHSIGKANLEREKSLSCEFTCEIFVYLII